MSGNAAPAFLDENGDGIADELRFIEVRCGLIFQAITNIRVDEGSFYAKFKIFNEWHVQAEGLYATQLSRASTNSAVGKHHLNAGIDKLFPPTYLLNRHRTAPSSCRDYKRADIGRARAGVRNRAKPNLALFFK